MGLTLSFMHVLLIQNEHSYSCNVRMQVLCMHTLYSPLCHTNYVFYHEAVDFNRLSAQTLGQRFDW